MSFEEMFARRSGYTEPVLIRMVVNPMYATSQGNPALLEVAPEIDPDDWVELQASAIEGAEHDGNQLEGVGVDRWLNTLLAWLEGEIPADHPISPARAVSVDPVLVEEHPPLVDRETWKQVQQAVIDEQGLYTWLDELLAVIGGAKVINGPDGEPMIDDSEPRGVNAEALDRFVLGKLQAALEAGALADALQRLDREDVLQAIANGTVATVSRLITRVNVGGPFGRPSAMSRVRAVRVRSSSTATAD